MNNWQHFATFKIGGRKITAPQFQLPANPIKIQASADSSPTMDQTEIMTTQHLSCATTCAVGCGQLFRPNQGTKNMLMRVLAMTRQAPLYLRPGKQRKSQTQTQARKHEDIAKLSVSFVFQRMAT